MSIRYRWYQRDPGDPYNIYDQTRRIVLGQTDSRLQATYVVDELNAGRVNDVREAFAVFESDHTARAAAESIRQCVATFDATVNGLVRCLESEGHDGDHFGRSKPGAPAYKWGGWGYTRYVDGKAAETTVWGSGSLGRIADLIFGSDNTHQGGE